MEQVRWRIGVLRRGEENIDWVADGTESEWGIARAATIGAVRDLVDVEGRQEYRLQIADVEGIVNPGLDAYGQLVLGDLERLIPVARQAV